ncbi:hypothetical protein GCM10022409_13510 [Hymenobacter glaciei]|uniref:Uncharacterized protein n=1 Tax=Hymenobacter glaciei TaxID=877209 RepID=A0ABP7TSD9_9BACT
MLRLDRTVTRKTTLHADQDVEDVAYWLTKAPEERMAAIEIMRQLAYPFHLPNHDEGQPAQPRLQRIYRIIKRSRG